VPTEILGFEEIDDADFERLMREMRKASPSYLHPSMVDLMQMLAETDRPLLVRLRDTQTPRSVRNAIMNVGRHRGLRLQTVSGDQVVAVRRLGFLAEEETGGDAGNAGDAG
jgi:predicted transcriptional regulator